MNVKKIKNVRQIKDNIYFCEVEVYLEEDKKTKVFPYVVNTEDASETNLWILQQISTGKYKIKDQRV